MVKMAWQDTYDGKRKLWYNAHGICRDCGQREVEPHTQLCFECANRKYKKAKEYYKNHRDEINERNKQTAKKRYAERKASGICVKCGKHKALENKTLCLNCYLKKRKIKDPRWNNEVERSERPQYGLCYVCAKPLTGHHSLCDECLTRSRKLMVELNKNPTDKMKENIDRFKNYNNVIFYKNKLKERDNNG